MVKDTLNTSKDINSAQPIIDNKIIFLAKGHLAPDAGFVYRTEADATYFFINVAPQFQSFNNGHWKALEIATREIAIR